MSKALFALGLMVATPGALQALEEAHVSPMSFLQRHVTGDWGECGKYDRTTLTPEEEELGAFATSDDAKLNKWGVHHAGRILSAYTLATCVRIWVLTESDRSYSTILKPEEY
jgi:hypothetical protein